MRTEGTLRNWNDDRSFGFIVTIETKQDVFVHVSAFPQTGRRPQPGERLAFSIDTGHDGKKRAVSVNYLDPATLAGLSADTAPRGVAQVRPRPQNSVHARAHATRHRHDGGHRRGRDAAPRRVGGLLTLTALACIGAAIVRGESIAEPPPAAATHSATAAAASDAPLPLSSAPASGAFRCDGRTHCSQMRSCAEARYFVRHCPGVAMDGNHDGEPCERQWCK